MNREDKGAWTGLIIVLALLCVEFCIVYADNQNYHKTNNHAIQISGNVTHIYFLTEQCGVILDNSTFFIAGPETRPYALKVGDRIEVILYDQRYNYLYAKEIRVMGGKA